MHLLRNFKIILFVFFIALVSFLFGGMQGFKINSMTNHKELNYYLIANSFYINYALDKSLSQVVVTKANPVTCPENYKAIALFGQSNSANRIKRPKGLESVDDGKTFMWNWATQKCYPYAEPVVGTDGDDSGNIITSMIKEFRKLDKKSNLIIIAFGSGGTSVFSWSHAFESIRLIEVLKRLKSNHITPSLFLWHQGESDVVPETYVQEKAKAYGLAFGTKRYWYEMALDVIVNNIRDSFPSAIVGIAVASICNNNGSEEIRDAQKAIANKYPWTEISSNTDIYGEEYRLEGCHFNEKGEKFIAKDYLNLFLKTLNSKVP